MAVDLRHLKVSSVPDNGDPTIVQGPDWNAAHVLTQGPTALLGRTDAAPLGPTVEVPISSIAAAIGGPFLPLAGGHVTGNVTIDGRLTAGANIAGMQHQLLLANDVEVSFYSVTAGEVVVDVFQSSVPTTKQTLNFNKFGGASKFSGTLTAAGDLTTSKNGGAYFYFNVPDNAANAKNWRLLEGNNGVLYLDALNDDLTRITASRTNFNRDGTINISGQLYLSALVNAAFVANATDVGSARPAFMLQKQGTTELLIQADGVTHGQIYYQAQAAGGVHQFFINGVSAAAISATNAVFAGDLIGAAVWSAAAGNALHYFDVTGNALNKKLWQIGMNDAVGALHFRSLNDDTSLQAEVVFNRDGTMDVVAPAAADNSTKVPSTAWVRANAPNLGAYCMAFGTGSAIPTAIALIPLAAATLNQGGFLVGSRFTPPAGVYRVECSMGIVSATAAVGLVLTLRKNGVDYARGFDTAPGAGTVGGVMVSALVSMNGTDFVEPFWSAGSAQTGDAISTYFNAQKVA